MTLRFRLAIRFIVVILLASGALSIITIENIGRILIREVEERVRLDLNSARTAYHDHAEHIALFLRASAMDPTIVKDLEGNTPASDRLQRMRETVNVDRLCMVDLEGRAIDCTDAFPRRMQDLSHNTVVVRALQERRVSTGTVIVPATPSRNGVPATTTREASEAPDGFVMAVAAAVPVENSDGQLAGLLYGASVLNHRYDIVDGIRNEVFQGQAYEGRPVGTATIFQGDLRISTNVLTAAGERAVGTRMPREVAQTVLVEGATYNAPAFAVNDWYITAYEPIRDPNDRVIGALYVGVLQEPFTRTRTAIVHTFLVVVSATTLVILLLLYVVTRQVLRPIQRIAEMSRRVVGGDLSARVGLRPPGELGQLCVAIDRMADAVAEREEQLKLATRRQIGQSEKLASIGRLAAGVAHEVNNPLTGVLTFTHLLRGKPNLDEQDRADLDLVIRETTRVRDIVRNLLDFARESPSRKQPLDLNELIRHVTRLLASQKEFRRIRIVEHLTQGLPAVLGDQNQLQQVLLNLSLNACEAMPEGGTLKLNTQVRADEVIVTVADTGHGIGSEDIDKIFEPFYTTKPQGKGTGLGLSVSYGIVQQHGGNIEVTSEPGKGTVFTVALPLKAEQETGDSEQSP
ncbi:MAG: hypothetical protein AMXMBFR13_06350 [Phycisphaerae bacterium]